jgi:hypothetical protein
MTDDIRVGVSGQASRMVDPHPAQDQGPSIHESMRVMPNPNPQRSAPPPATIVPAPERQHPGRLGSRQAPEENRSELARFCLSPPDVLDPFPFFVQREKTGKNCFKFCTFIQNSGDAIKRESRTLSLLLKGAYSEPAEWRLSLASFVRTHFIEYAARVRTL